MTLRPTVSLLYPPRFLGQFSAKPARVWFQANAPKIQSVGIPANLHDGVGLSVARAVIRTRLNEQLNVFARQVIQMALACDVRNPPTRTLPMIHVVVLVFPAAIVEQGKQSRHSWVDVARRCQNDGVMSNARPVSRSVIPPAIQCELVQRQARKLWRPVLCQASHHNPRRLLLGW